MASVDSEVWRLGLGIRGLGFRVKGLGGERSRVWDLGLCFGGSGEFRVLDLGFCCFFFVCHNTFRVWV